MQAKEKPIICVLRNKLPVANNTLTLCFETLSGEIFEFKSGQYVVISIKNAEANNTIGKMYTISSAPGFSTFKITVRRIGPFSGILHDLKIGDKVSVTGPYGELCPREGLEQMVCLAGGIGITPFYSMIEQFGQTKNNQPKNITVMYSNKTQADAAFLRELDDYSKSLNGLKIINTFTRESINKSVSEEGRIDEKLIKKYVKNLSQCEYFICGSIDFSDSMWRTLNKIGIPEERIFIETFY